jgi:hypothetical protein
MVMDMIIEVATWTHICPTSKAVEVVIWTHICPTSMQWYGHNTCPSSISMGSGGEVEVSIAVTDPRRNQDTKFRELPPLKSMVSAISPVNILHRKSEMLGCEA